MTIVLLIPLADSPHTHVIKLEPFLKTTSVTFTLVFISNISLSKLELAIPPFINSFLSLSEINHLFLTVGSLSYTLEVSLILIERSIPFQFRLYHHLQPYLLRCSALVGDFINCAFQSPSR